MENCGIQSGQQRALGRVWRHMAGIVVALALVACSPIVRNHGYVPTEENLATIAIGDTQATVEEKIGRPGTEGILDASGWYYVKSQFSTLGAFEPKEVDRQVVAISFSPSGRVTNVERFGLEQGRVVALSRRVTEANVSGTTFIDQLFGNLGRVTADQLIQ